MDTQLVPGHDVGLATVANFRDLGGYHTRSGGRVRVGLVYRSTSLHRLDGADAQAFGQLGIRAVIDLRTDAERSAEPDRLPPGTAYIVADVLRDATSMSPAALMQLLQEPKAAEEALGDGRVAEIFGHKYREFVSLESARAGYRRLFTALTDDAHRPALFHCSTGKDRTGWAAAALLMLLGVADDIVMEDFLLSNAYLLPAFEPAFERFRALGGDPALLRPLIGVRPGYLAAALEEMCRRHGTIERYFAEGLRIDAETQDRLRAVFVEHAAAAG